MLIATLPRLGVLPQTTHNTHFQLSPLPLLPRAQREKVSRLEQSLEDQHAQAVPADFGQDEELERLGEHISVLQVG